MINERQLIKDCLKGNATAQKQLYDQFAPLMLGVCFRYTKSMTDAEDILQEGFIKVFKNLQQYKGEAEPGAWIRRIMVNAALDFLKKNHRYQNELVFSPDNALHPVSNDNPEVHLGGKEIAALIRQLPSGYQTIFNLYAVEGYSHTEIGQLLGIQEGTSRSQYARARALLVTWIENSQQEQKTQVYAGKRI